MRITILLALALALAGAGLADSLYVHIVDCVHSDLTPDSGYVRLDSAGTAIDSGYCDTDGEISSMSVEPGVEYTYTVDYDDHSGYWDIDTGYIFYGDTATAVHVLACASPAYPSAMVYSFADPLVTAMDTIIVTWTNSNGADTLYIDTTDAQGLAYLPAWDTLTVGTTYRVYIDDQADDYNDRYYTIAWDTLSVAPLKAYPLLMAECDTITWHIIDPSTNRPPARTINATWRVIGYDQSQWGIADTSGTYYLYPLNSNVTISANQDGEVILIMPTGTAGYMTIPGTWVSNWFTIVDSTYDAGKIGIK
jgi:hypothetical protein